MAVDPASPGRASATSVETARDLYERYGANVFAFTLSRLGDRHDAEDELFLVVKGRFRMEFRDRHVWLEEGELLIVPRGVEHRPVADEECHVLLFEPAGTLNTGNVRNERTIDAGP